ncbi:ABC transporter ATP-binding protein [Streptomyces sp. NPDC102384]|uniref:ABC transporter ATP-binding protein n=1 Tax=Streptomyces sp. NPDC102384 TaxID=3366166 RepID=UPI003810AF81
MTREATKQKRSRTEPEEPTPAAAEATARASAALSVEHLRLTFTRADGTHVKPMDDISFSIERGELLVLLGPSGCGKTTLLRAIAGLAAPDEGTIAIAGRTVFDAAAGRARAVPPEKRGVGMIFQSYALWPHLTVAENVAYPLAAAKVPRRDRAERVERALGMAGIAEVAGQLPGRLSGGQQQRVALARALVAESELVLFDEPLSNVDAKVREELRLQLRETQRRVGFTAVYVTHDQVEAMEMADRIAVLDRGRVVQVGPPDQLYRQPASAFVARFIGTANELTATVVATHGDSLTAELPGGMGRCELPAPATGPHPANGTPVHVIWRPEHTVIDGREPDPGGLVLPGKFILGRYLGAFSEALVELTDGTRVRAASTDREFPETGRPLGVGVARESLHVFPTEAAA